MLRVYELLNLHLGATYTIVSGSVVECSKFNANKQDTECPPDSVLQKIVTCFEAKAADEIVIYVSVGDEEGSLRDRCIKEYKYHSDNMSAMACAGLWLSTCPDNPKGEFDQALIDHDIEDDDEDNYYCKVRQIIDDALYDEEDWGGPTDDEPLSEREFGEIWNNTKRNMANDRLAVGYDKNGFPLDDEDEIPFDNPRPRNHTENTIAALAEDWLYEVAAENGEGIHGLFFTEADIATYLEFYDLYEDNEITHAELVELAQTIVTRARDRDANTILVDFV